MILYPAIDLKGGQCVRLVHGDMDQATVFDTDPAARAKTFAAAGCDWLHVVDLDGAFAGRAVNGDAVRAILAATDMRVQLGGGIRDIAAVDAWLDAGVSRVILGTAAVKDPAFVRAACAKYPGRVAVGIDARAGLVAVEGWAETSTTAAHDLAAAMTDAGAAAFVFTNIDRDGALQGVDVAATAALAAATDVPVIASGGVAGLDDLHALRAAGGIAGVICGRALYDGRLDLAAGLAALRD